MLKIKDKTKKFQLIYQKNLWNNCESKSGSGSTLYATRSIRHSIDKIIEQYDIKSIVDIPCGDFNWMSDVIERNPVSYIGCDIVRDIIDENLTKYSAKFVTKDVNFKVLDICAERLPKADLLIVRDLLFHLSFADIKAAEVQIANSGCKYLLTSSHDVGSDFKNKDILSGDFRPIDITKKPFNFSRYRKIHVFDDGSEKDRFSKVMILYELKKNGYEDVY